MPEVSVVVPVYNAQEHLRQCLDSILAQTLTDFELICVDDGSIDASLGILREYSARDARMKVLQQEHGYAGRARNLGMSQASAPYLVFWDADDYFMPDALKKMHAKCVKDDADICVCGAKRYYEELQQEISVSSYVKKSFMPDTIPFSSQDNQEYILNFTNESVWNKMFRRSFVQEQGLAFQPVRNGDDVFFVACALCLAKRITVVFDRLVCYRTLQRKSLVGSMEANPLAPVRAWIDVRRELDERGALPKNSYIRKAASAAAYSLHNMSTWDTFAELFELLRTDGLQEMLLLPVQDEGFYIAPWHREFLLHLSSDEPKDFLAYFAYTTFRQKREEAALKTIFTEENAQIKREINSIKHSRSYKFFVAAAKILHRK